MYIRFLECNGSSLHYYVLKWFIRNSVFFLDFNYLIYTNLYTSLWFHSILLKCREQISNTRSIGKCVSNSYLHSGDCLGFVKAAFDLYQWKQTSRPVLCLYSFVFMRRSVLENCMIMILMIYLSNISKYY